MFPATWHRPGIAGGLLPALSGWVGGTALQLTQPALWPWWGYGGVLALGCTVLLGVARVLRSGPRWAHHACLLLAVVALAFGCVGLRAVGFLAHTLSPALEGRELLITGVVATMPQRGANGLRFQLHVESARGHADAVPVRVPPRVQLGWYGAHGSGGGDAAALAGRLPPVWASERWRMVVRLKAPHGNSNPHGFDYELWLWEHGVQATGYVRDTTAARAPQRLAQTGRHPVEWLRQRVRQRIDLQLAEAPQAGWITALVTGDQNAIDRADWDVFRATGVSHLMSISGLHVTMFAWLAATLTAALWRASPRLCLLCPAAHAGWIGGPALALAYAVFSGWGVPAQRTVVMLAVVCLLRLSSRSWPWPMAWLLAGVTVLSIDPWALLQAGFWLSFVAVGVLFAAGDRANGQPVPARQRLRAMLREQWIITLALTPLVLLLFGQVSLVGFVANLFAIPWVTLLVTPLAMLGTVFAPAWELAALAVAVLARVLAWMAGLPFATVSVASAPFAVAATAVLGGVLVAMRLPAALRLAGAALVLPVLLWQAPRPDPGRFDLLAVDVGQGNAVLVRTARHALLYDAGPRYSRDSDAGHRVLVPLLRALGVAPDLLVLSHSDSDHVGGAASVLEMVPGMSLTGSMAPDHALWALRPVRHCAAGQRWHWDGVEFLVLHPRQEPIATALLAGDIESAQEQQLVTDRVDLRADLLLVPHHGSKTSSSAVFLDAVRPRVALVQSGYRNRFGHPAPEPMARYLERGIDVFNSPHCGAMAWRSEAPAVVSCHRLAHPRYWQHRGDGQSRF